MGEKETKPFQLTFNGLLKVDFQDYWLLLAEGYLNRRLFGDMLRRIWALPVPGG